MLFQAPDTVGVISSQISLGLNQNAVGLLFEKLVAQVKGAERSGTLTVEGALECATRLPEALFCSLMDSMAESGENPQAVVVQVARLQDHLLKRLREIAFALAQHPHPGMH